VASECENGEEKDEEKQPVPSCLMQKGAHTAVSILNSIKRCIGVSDSTETAMDTCKRLLPRHKGTPKTGKNY
jgi:hypothetical protein